MTFGALVLWFAAMLPGSARMQAIHHRNLGCADHYAGRAKGLCESIQAHLEFTCCGHANIDPGYRASWQSIKAVWCTNQINTSDVSALLDLARAEDWRLASAAESLVALATGRDAHGMAVPENSILSPRNANFLLRDGCSSGASAR